jgi:hypothetical protein
MKHSRWNLRVESWDKKRTLLSSNQKMLAKGGGYK